MYVVDLGVVIRIEVVGEVVGLEFVSVNEVCDILMELMGLNILDVVFFGIEVGIFVVFGMYVVVCGLGLIEQVYKLDEFFVID